MVSVFLKGGFPSKIKFTDVMMLGKGISYRQKLLKLQKWIQATNYSTSTQQESIETILRSEFSESSESFSVF